MVALELEPEVEERVRRIAAENHVSESFLITEALLRWLEDREDYALGVQALSAMKSTVSQEEMERLSNVGG